jgi:hypothetical protein
VLEGELTMSHGGHTRILEKGEGSVIEPNVWHDWWNASDRDARVRVDIRPGERFVNLIETCYGLARACRIRCNLLLARRGFSDVIVFRAPPS